MSAAAPPPPPPPHIVPVFSSDGAQTSGEQAGQNGQPRQFAHIQDLVRQADSQVQENDTFDRLLQRVSNALKSARTNIDFGRPDYAFVEFRVAFMILSKILPHHKDFPKLLDHPRLKQFHSDCLKRSRVDQATYDHVLSLVQENNRISGVMPRLNSSQNQEVLDRPNGYVQVPLRGHSRPQSVQFPAVPSSPPMVRTNPDSRPSSVGSSRSDDPTSDARPRPPVHAKPTNLQRHTLATNGRHIQSKTGNDLLLSRFSALRVTSGASEIPSRYSTDSSTSESASGTQRSAAQSSLVPQSDLSKELPKLPSATYSPAPTVQDGSASTMPQVSIHAKLASSEAASIPSVSLLSDSASQLPQETPLKGGSSRVVPNDSHGPPNSHRKNNPTSQETEIDCQKLYDYLKIFAVLLIDVRSREEFDTGHIWNNSIVCIEPAALRPNRSAEELQDTLVIGTDHEYGLFSQRDEFELVVYFDQNTSSTSFLRQGGNEDSPLRYLHDSLHLYNEEKPLKQQPILLLGGMDAWVDLAGENSLTTSNTVASRTAGVKPSRPIARRPLASGSARLNISKKRHRDYNPLDPDEERKWRDRALSESIVMQFPSQRNEEPEKEEAVHRFELRYPDIPALEYQALAGYPPSRSAPEAPPIPPYMELPPSVPTRPPPAMARPSYRGVSERVATPTQQLSKTTHLPQHIPNEMRRLPRTGLFNFGVTCYMNATLQCLSATLPLSAFFLTHRYLQDIQKDNWKGSKGILSGLYCKLLEHLWQPKGFDTVRPKHFRQFCARLNREWGYDRQQDAKEFLEFLIDTFHEDFNMNWARNPLRALNPDEEAARERTSPFLASKREFARYQHRDSSKLTNLFAGQHISRLQCTTCNNSSTTYETFYSMSVEIPTPAKGCPVSIHDCLRSYCSSEVLSGDEVWRCPHCKKDREATKRITISRAPEFLVIHFKRFSASLSEKARKVHTPVEFDLTGLDLGPYMLEPPAQVVIDGLERRFGPGSFEVETPRSMQAPFRYDAYAVMRHLGNTMTSGHYTALCKDQSTGMWRDYNDDTVRDFRPESLSSSKKLQNEQAYIVFYQRTH